MFSVFHRVQQNGLRKLINNNNNNHTLLECMVKRTFNAPEFTYCSQNTTNASISSLHSPFDLMFLRGFKNKTHSGVKKRFHTRANGSAIGKPSGRGHGMTNRKNNVWVIESTCLYFTWLMIYWRRLFIELLWRLKNKKKNAWGLISTTWTQLIDSLLHRNGK